MGRLIYSVLVLAIFGGIFAVKPIAAADDSTPLITEDFESCALNPAWNGSFVRQEEYQGDGTPFVAMDGHGCVLEQYVAAGRDEVTSAQVGVEGAPAMERITGSSEVEEFYVEWDEFLSSDHDFPDGAQKMMRFTYWVEGEERGPGIMLEDQYNNGNLQISYSHPGIDAAQSSNRGMPLDRWAHVAVWCKLNTPGAADGFCRAWLDGEQIIDIHDADMRGSDARGFNIMWIGGNYTNQKPTEQASKRFIDNIRWYRTKPAEAAAAPAPVDPAAAAAAAVAPAPEAAPSLVPAEAPAPVELKKSKKKSKKSKKQKKQKKSKKKKTKNKKNKRK